MSIVGGNPAELGCLVDEIDLDDSLLRGIPGMEVTHPAGVTLVGTFVRDGTGVSVYGCNLIEALALQTDLSIRTLRVSGGIPMPPNGRVIPFSDVVTARIAYFRCTSLVRDQLVHYTDVEFIPPTWMREERVQICTLHDLFVFHPKHLELTSHDWNVLVKPLALARARYRRILHNRLMRCDAIVVTSDSLSRMAIDQFGLNPRQMHVVPPVIQSRFVPRPRPPSSLIRLGYINNFHRNKVAKLKLFIRHFKLVNNPQLRFEIYGNGFPLFDEIREDSRISYHGFLTDDRLAEVHNSFDAFVITDEYSGFSAPAMQSKACGVPVLCYKGDLPEITTRNTVLWDESNIAEVLKGQTWRAVNRDLALEDAASCTPYAVGSLLRGVYSQVAGIG